MEEELVGPFLADLPLELPSWLKKMIETLLEMDLDQERQEVEQERTWLICGTSG